MNTQDQINQLQSQVIQLTQQLHNLQANFYKDNFSSDIIFRKNVTFAGSFAFGDGSNIPLGTTTGTKIGTSTSQKLGFYNKTPITQPAGISAPSGGGTQDTQARTAITSIINALNSLGLTG